MFLVNVLEFGDGRLWESQWRCAHFSCAHSLMGARKDLACDSAPSDLKQIKKQDMSGKRGRSAKLFIGTILHSKSLTELEILEPGLLLVNDQGCIDTIVSAKDLDVKQWVTDHHIPDDQVGHSSIMLYLQAHKAADTPVIGEPVSRSRTR
jgi:hypothetical protein